MAGLVPAILFAGVALVWGTVLRQAPWQERSFI